MKKKILQLLGMVLFVGLLAGCGSNNEKTVVFSDAGWDSVKFHNAVAGLIAEKAYGLKVETMNGSTPALPGNQVLRVGLAASQHNAPPVDRLMILN
jgi:glycine betaine/proline transport system substrate-binding protein